MGTHLKPVLPAIPLHGSGEVLDGLVEPLVSAKLLVVRRENNRVLAGPVGADAVVRERLGGVEVEDEEEVSTLEDNDLIGL